MISISQTSLTAAAAIALLGVAPPALPSANVPTRLVATIADFHGKYGLVVQDARGNRFEVILHQGTVITPTGLRLERGMVVTIIGKTAAGTVAAAEIDTAYKIPPQRVANAQPNGLPGRSDGQALHPTGRGDPNRWSEGPDQFGLPPAPDPREPRVP